MESPGGRTADYAVQYDLSACKDQRCSEIRDLVASLKTTVEVLEAELECFKVEVVKESKTHQSDSVNEGWVIGLVGQRVSPSTRVGGTCRPGAKLLTVADSSLSPPGSCYVLFTGTNDVAADESYTIFEHLERQLTARLSSSAVIVSTVPHRHDLFMDHAVNQRIALVNFYIEELCVRYKGIEMPNFNEIRRRWFTQHSMHLRLVSGCWLSFCWGVLIVSVSHQPSGPLPHLLMLPRLVRPPPVHPVEPVVVGSTTSTPVPLLKTPGPASSRFALVSPPAGAMTRPGNKTFAEAMAKHQQLFACHLISCAFCQNRFCF
ncbi:hypothetical protein J6590_068687 [Homalodisca vitripennis]|nr:hypothetical protein J6590_068687 [Homalodisca vitripennis]